MSVMTYNVIDNDFMQNQYTKLFYSCNVYEIENKDRKKVAKKVAKKVFQYKHCSGHPQFGL